MIRPAAVALLGCLLASAILQSSPGDIRHITILHTNDLHAHVQPDREGRGGLAQLAAMLRREASKGQSLYFDAGDLVQGTPVSTLFHGTPLYELSNLLRVDAATMGNHEFDYGWRQALEYQKIAGYPIVVGNVVDARHRPVWPPYVIKTVNGVRVGIIGAVMGDLIDYITPQLLGPLRVLPVVPVVAQYANELRRKCELIVVLGHIHVEEAQDVLRHVPEVSAVIKGHDHEGTARPLEVAGRIAVWCVPYGVEFGRLDLDVDLAAKTAVSWKWRRLSVDAAAVPPAEDVENAVERWESRVSRIVDVRIAEARRDYDESALRELLERAILADTKADFTCVNAGAIRARLLRGPVSIRDIWNIVPFDDRIRVASIPGSRLSEPIRRDRQVQPDRSYTVALTDCVVENPRELKRLGLEGIEFKPTSRGVRDLFVDWIRNKQILE